MYNMNDFKALSHLIRCSIENPDARERRSSRMWMYQSSLKISVDNTMAERIKYNKFELKFD